MSIPLIPVTRSEILVPGSDRICHLFQTEGPILRKHYFMYCALSKGVVQNPDILNPGQECILAFIQRISFYPIEAIIGDYGM